MSVENEALCICGHEAQDHHRSWFPGGYELIEECEYYASNEHGGMEPRPNGWYDHCFRFRKKEL